MQMSVSMATFDRLIIMRLSQLPWKIFSHLRDLRGSCADANEVKICKAWIKVRLQWNNLYDQDEDKVCSLGTKMEVPWYKLSFSFFLIWKSGSHLLVLTGHDVGHTEVGEDDGAHTQDLYDTIKSCEEMYTEQQPLTFINIHGLFVHWNWWK